MYKIGDYIVKATDGVCRVDDITHPDLPGADQNKMYYVLTPVFNTKGKVYASTEKLEATARRVMTEEEVWSLIERMPEIEMEWIDNDKLRQETYKKAVNACDPEALVKIIKLCYRRKKQRQAMGKKNTSLDERYSQLAEDFLYSEIGFTLNKEKSQIGPMIAEHIHGKQECMA